MKIKSGSISVSIIGIFMCLMTISIGAMDLSGVHAYPVPFNPNRSTKSAIIIDGLQTLPAGGTCEMEVFDINGDLVTKRTFTSYTGLEAVKWNARTDSGSRVKPGMYIIKITIDYNGTGDFAKKLIRVLVAY
jgi:hypothetical protein